MLYSVPHTAATVIFLSRLLNMLQYGLPRAACNRQSRWNGQSKLVQYPLHCCICQCTANVHCNRATGDSNPQDQTIAINKIYQVRTSMVACYSLQCSIRGAIYG